MNALNNMKTFLSVTGSSGVASVLFDLQDVVNTNIDKSYPLVFWNVNTIKFNDNFRQNKRKFSIRCFIVAKYISEEETTLTKLQQWDAVQAIFKTYIDNLVSVSGNYSYDFTDLDNVEGEYYDRGQTSIDEEIGIGYTMNLESFC